MRTERWLKTMAKIIILYLELLVSSTPKEILDDPEIIKRDDRAFVPILCDTESLNNDYDAIIYHLPFEGWNGVPFRIRLDKESGEIINLDSDTGTAEIDGTYSVYLTPDRCSLHLSKTR